jgi:hypothetical protein
MNRLWRVLPAAATLTQLIASSAHANPTVIVISGGNSEFENHGRYYEKIEQLMQLYPATSWNHYHLVADGPGTQPNSPALDEERGSPVVDAEGKAKLVRRDPPSGAVFYKAATIDSIREAFQKASRDLKPDEPVLVYISDHGSLNNDGVSTVRLWKSFMTSDEISRNVLLLNERQRVVMFHEQCFGGDGVEELFGPNGKLHADGKQRNACGFSASSPGRTSSSTEQLMPLLYQSLQNPKLRSSLTDTEGAHQFSGLLNQAHLRFTTNPLSSSEIFLLSYLEQNQTKARPQSGEENCKNPNLITQSPVVRTVGEAALLDQKETFKSWASQVNLTAGEIQKLRKRCNALAKVDVSDSAAVRGVLDKCSGELHVQANKIAQKMFKQKQEIGELFLASLSPELQQVPAKIKKAHNILKLIHGNLSDEQEKENPDPNKIARMKKGIENKQAEMNQLEELARPIREGQKSAVEGKNPEFLKFLANRKKENILKDFLEGQEELKENMTLKSHIARIKYPDQLSTALDLVSQDADALATYLALLKCETEPFGIKDGKKND